MDVTGVIFTHVGAVTPVITAVFSAPARKGYIGIHAKSAGQSGLGKGVYT